MIEINLLPWRSFYQARKTRQKIIILLMSSVSVAMVEAICYCSINHFIAQQIARNQNLQAKIAQLNSEIYQTKQYKQLKKNIFLKIQLLRTVERTRLLTIHFFKMLMHIMPNEIYLTQLARVDQRIVLLGHASSNHQITLLMSRLEKAPWLQNSILLEIRKSQNVIESAENEFKLSCILKDEYAHFDGGNE